MTIKSAFSTFAAAVLLSGCATMSGASSSGEPIVGPIREGRCHMGGCGWFQVQSFDVVRENEKGALLRVTQRNGQTTHGNGNPPRRPREAAIDWSAETETYYLFCSSRYPAIISRNEAGGGYDGFRLDMTMPSGATEYVQNQYRAVCHPDGALDADTAAAARRLGYAPFDGEAEFTVARPEDVFDRAG